MVKKHNKMIVLCLVNYKYFNGGVIEVVHFDATDKNQSIIDP